MPFFLHFSLLPHFSSSLHIYVYKVCISSWTRVRLKMLFELKAKPRCETNSFKFLWNDFFLLLFLQLCYQLHSHLTSHGNMFIFCACVPLSNSLLIFCVIGIFLWIVEIIDSLWTLEIDFEISLSNWYFRACNIH